MSDTQTEKNWLDVLDEQIEEMLSDPKQVKFNTHKNRKLFLGKLKALIKDAVHKNTMPIPDKIQRHSTPTITHPMQDRKPVGYSVMTEGLSSRGDDIAGTKPERIVTNDNATSKIRNNNAGGRSW